MIEREALKYLSAWAQSSDRKPLVIRGARQVGKTTLINEFAKNYGVYLKLNLEKEADLKLFKEFRDIHQLTDAIFIHNKKEKRDSDTLLFIDEIQNAPEAVAMLRYFYEEMPRIHVVAAGSLLESIIDKEISFPVGRVEYMALHPCSFKEFLSGIGELFDRDLIDSLRAESVHDRLIHQFKIYTILGGMPAVVSKYAEKRDIYATNPLFDSLLTAYRDDIEKYARNTSQAHILRFLLEEGWRYASDHVTFQRFGKSDYRSREIGEAFRTLEKALLCELVYPTTSARMPLYKARARKPKLFWLDTGIVNFVAGMMNDLFLSHDVQDVWLGRIAEHIVAQELKATESTMSSSRIFWIRDKDQSTAEVDFIKIHKGRPVPIEVKTGHNAHLKSLHKFMESTSHNIAVRVWSKPYSVDEVYTSGNKRFLLINLPFYYVGVLDKVLDAVNNSTAF